MGPTSARAARRALGIAVVLVGLTAAVGVAATPDRARRSLAGESGVLTGTWAGVLIGSARGSIRRERIVIVVDAHETAGSWKVGATCHGSLTLDSISGGYHHYRRRVAPGASCLGGDVDCLMRAGADLYDSITPHPGGAALNGTLRRVRRG